MIRRPAVAGTFYPADPKALEEEIAGLVAGRRPPREPAAIAVMVPHAGYIYSGGIAADTYLATCLPERVVILGPNHTGMGEPIAVMAEGAWRTPFGDARIDAPLAAAILERCSGASIDAVAHQRERGGGRLIAARRLDLRHHVAVGIERLRDRPERRRRQLARHARQRVARDVVVDRRDQHHDQPAPLWIARGHGGRRRFRERDRHQEHGPRHRQGRGYPIDGRRRRGYYRGMRGRRGIRGGVLLRTRLQASISVV